MLTSISLAMRHRRPRLAASNVGAMLVYGIALCVAFIASWLTLGLGLIVLVPVIAISTYTGYRDVFERPTAES